MPRKRDWNTLSSGYQSRLLRNGITKQAYEAGANLSKARGHAHTPEHPEDAIKKPSKYRKYINNLKQLQQQVIERKEQIWGNRHKYNSRRAKEHVLRGVPPDFNKPGAMTLRRMLAATDQEWERYVLQAAQGAQDIIEDDWNVLFYH